LGIYAAIQLRDVHPRALEMNGRFLAAAFVWSAICGVLPFAADIPDDRRDAMVIPSMVNFWVFVSYVVIWSLYLRSSKRMKATYGEFYAKLQRPLSMAQPAEGAMSALGTTSAAPLYAGFWRRAAAASVDALVIGSFVRFIDTYVVPDGVLRLLAGTILYCAYYAGFHSSSSQATPGKKYLGIKVTDYEGGRIGLGRAIGRYFATLLSFIVLGIGFLMAAFTQKRQTLHDMICSTLVVNRSAQPDEVVAGGGVMPVTARVAFVLVVPLVGILVAIVAILIPAYWDDMLRVRVVEVISASRPLKEDVERAISEKRAWTTGEVPIGSKYASGAQVTPQGDVVVSVSDDISHGGRIRFTPSTTSGGVQWKCTGEDIRKGLLPAACRE
jgi:uncharacterized RDD family membrane protein YckC